MIEDNGYSYSQAMQDWGQGKTWTFDELNQFLAGPQAFIPGTKMSFAGFKNVQDRANVIAFLNSNSDNPLPLPAGGGAAPQHSTELPAPAAQ